jgi:serine/threonine protein kinase
MPLSSATRLGPYEILSQIGSGGMGEVYKALDTRLGREVAIKVVGEDFSRRFELEARTVASLNHPAFVGCTTSGPTTW